MDKLNYGLAVGATFALCILVDPPAKACSVPTRLSFIRSPVDGTSNVPTNAAVYMVAAGDGLTDADVLAFELQELQPDGGYKTVTATNTALPHSTPYIRVVELRPATALLPATTYRVIDPLGSGFATPPTFVTGAQTLDAAPAAPLGASGATDPANLDTCDNGQERTIQFTFPDAGQSLTYTFEEDAAVIASNERPLAVVFCGSQPHWNGSVAWALSPGIHSLTVRAVNSVGLPSTPVQLVVNADCSPHDAGPLTDGASAPPDGASPLFEDAADFDAADPLDSGAPLAREPSRAEAPDATSGGGGCATSATSNSTASLGASVAVLALGVMRRRRQKNQL